MRKATTLAEVAVMASRAAAPRSGPDQAVLMLAALAWVVAMATATTVVVVAQVAEAVARACSSRVRSSC